MAKKNVLDALLDVLTSNASSEIVGPIKQPVQKSNLSDKIPSAHSDFIISMILSNSNELFSDNRKRKPIFNARRKQKWTELVQQLNQSLNVDYSVERVKNNFHYRITSLKRNLSRITGNLGPEEEITECAAFKQLTEIDRLLYEAMRDTRMENGNSDTGAIRRKKDSFQFPTKSEKLTELSSPSIVVNTLFQQPDDPLLNDQYPETPITPDFERNHSNEFFQDNADNINLTVIQMVRVQTETLETMKQFMREHMTQQTKLLELINGTTEVLREATASLKKQANPQPCPTCSENFLETFIQAVNNNNPKTVNSVLSKKNHSR